MTLAEQSNSDLVAEIRTKSPEVRRPELTELRKQEIEERRVVLSTMPAHVTLEMTTRCNLVCAHCRRFHVQEEASNTRGVFGQDVVYDIVGSSGYMDDDVFERALDLVQDTEWVSLTGYGEPMMHPKFFDFARRLKERGHILDTISNGTLLNQKNVDKLVDIGFDLISISIDGARDETLKVIRGGAGADVLFGGLERLAKAKRARGLGRNDPPRISVNFAMGCFNIREMPELALKLVEYDAHVLYAHILEVGAGPNVLGEQLIYTNPEVREEAIRMVEETKRICAENGIATDIRAIPEAGGGDEPEGIALDSAFAALKRAVDEHEPEQRVYLPLAAIEQQRREMADKAREEPTDSTSNACTSHFAGPDNLTDQERRENERCIDFFRYALVTWSGKVLSCCFEKFGCGDLNVQSAEEVWNGPVYQKLRRGYFEDGIRWVCHGCARVLD